MKVPFKKNIHNFFQGPSNPGFRSVKVETETFSKNKGISSYHIQYTKHIITRIYPTIIEFVSKTLIRLLSVYSQFEPAFVVPCFLSFRTEFSWLRMGFCWSDTLKVLLRVFVTSKYRNDICPLRHLKQNWRKITHYWRGFTWSEGSRLLVYRLLEIDLDPLHLSFICFAA